MTPPQILTVPVVKGVALCPDCGLEIRVIDAGGAYKRTRGCSHVVAVKILQGQAEVDYVRDVA